MSGFNVKPGVVAIIPARSGSKTLPHKNIRPIGGRPMLAWSIQQALDSELVDRVIVSTDSEQYAEIATAWGAEVPGLRPAEFAQDHSTDFDVFQHVLQRLQETEGSIPEVLVHLRPTDPIRPPKLIDRMVATILKSPEIDSVRSICKATETPYKMWRLQENGQVLPLLQSNFKDHYNMPRQELPQVYFQNACVDVLRSRVIVEKHSMTGDVIHGFVMDESFDIDTESDFNNARSRLEQALSQTTNESTHHAASKQKTFCVDIDGVIAQLIPGNDYKLSKPLVDNIRIVNRLYDAGFKIILFTARGYVTGIDWTEVTAAHMKEWGVRYHELKFGKPAADYYIDDRLIDLYAAEALVPGDLANQAHKEPK